MLWQILTLQLVVSSQQPTARSPALAKYSRVTTPTSGFFDLFSESEEKKRQKDEAWKAQQEILKRRRDPDSMARYEQDVANRRRAEADSDAELKALQKSGGADALEKWRELTDSGKVLSSKTAERDADSSRLGSDGLVGERMDTKLPYIDAGYVDDAQPDLMAELGKLFGGGKEKPESDS